MKRYSKIYDPNLWYPILVWNEEKQFHDIVEMKGSSIIANDNQCIVRVYKLRRLGTI